MLKVIFYFYISFGRLLSQLGRAYWVIVLVLSIVSAIGLGSYLVIPKSQDDLKEDIFYVDRLNFNPKKGQRYGIYGYSVIEERRLYYTGIPRPDILERVIDNRNIDDRKIVVLYYHGTVVGKIVDRRAILTFVYDGKLADDIQEELRYLYSKAKNLVVFSILLMVMVVVFFVFPYLLYFFIKEDE